MIVLDTHIWVWWVHNDAQLQGKYREIIVATARIYDLSLLTADDKILSYAHVKLLK